MSKMTFTHHKGKGNRDRKATVGVSGRLRRTRVPRIESLEDRTLLATLQFSDGLGEQSTLDSVVQTENTLSNLNTPASQQFTHNDGTAVSNVTLTTAASTTGNPGVNLDILSQGSVAKHGIANVAVNAGLTDASGNIGAAIPVTIVASPDSSAENGDPVSVQLAFSFNVDDFAYNNATASFSYSLSYTYQGVTTPLASNFYSGGSGIGEISSAPLVTATLHAKIGDTFTLTYSEDLVGETVAPFLGAGINNVGWLVDATLDVSINNTFIPTMLQWNPDNSAAGMIPRISLAVWTSVTSRPSRTCHRGRTSSFTGRPATRHSAAPSIPAPTTPRARSSPEAKQTSMFRRLNWVRHPTARPT